VRVWAQVRNVKGKGDYPLINEAFQGSIYLFFPNTYKTYRAMQNQ
jgi:hypothetical protein